MPWRTLLPHEGLLLMTTGMALPVCRPVMPPTCGRRTGVEGWYRHSLFLLSLPGARSCLWVPYRVTSGSGQQ